MILAIETSTPVCSVALLAPDGVIYEKRESGKGIHSEKLFLFIESILKEHAAEPDQLGELLLSNGPGSYTGLRIGAAAVKGLLFRKETPLYLIGSLEAMAAGACITGAAIGRKSGEAGTVHSVIDARRSHLYYQTFRISEEQATRSDPVTLPLDEIEKRIKSGDSLIGTGLDRLKLNRSASSGDVHIQGETAISAVNLISARGHPLFREWFKQTDPASFEPEYLAMGQAGHSSG